jgi:hypothetical protein
VFCECGCGQVTPKAVWSSTARGIKKGQHIRFCHGHNRRGATFSDDHRQRISRAKQGVPCPDSTRSKLQGRKPSPNAIAAFKAAFTGTHQSRELVEKRVAPLRGKKRSPEAIENAAAPLRGKPRPLRSGARHWNWKGGEAKEYRNTGEYSRWRKAVKRRDGYACQLCSLHSKRKLHAHHIRPFTEYPDGRYDVDNGVTLCQPCHARVHAALSDFRERSHFKNDAAVSGSKNVVSSLLSSSGNCGLTTTTGHTAND